MCGRFVLVPPTDPLDHPFSDTQIPPDYRWMARYNIAPTQEVAIMRRRGGERELAVVRWGLLPPWGPEPRIAARPINARAETVATKPMFRDSFRRRRCLLPATGWYEWRREGRAKQPHYISRRDGRLLTFAGLWSAAPDPESDPEMQTCAIITTAANELVATVHDRMPAIVAAEDHATWLAEDAQREVLLSLLGPYRADELVARPVSTRVNSPANDGPELLALVEER